MELTATGRLEILKLITSAKSLLPYKVNTDQELGHEYLWGLLISLPPTLIPDPPISKVSEGGTY